MIISASRRTDIPALYSDWFVNRLKAGYALIPNPRSPNRLGRVGLSPDNVDCIVFWTKNPAPMMDKLAHIRAMGYAFYFQFTLTPYGSAMECNLPPIATRVQAFIALAKQTSAARVVWRYDPIIVNATFTVNWHLQHFARMCKALHPYTKRCILSFVDPYKSIGSAFRAITRGEMLAVAIGFSKIAKPYGLALFTCAEEIELAAFGIGHSSCIDQGLIEQIIACPITAKKDANQRPACACIESVDIGVYDTCTNGCAYCYATRGHKTAMRHFDAHDPNAPMISGYPNGNEIVTERTTASHKIHQLRLY